ncbi:acrosin-like [Siniperca chuatsi]|uniref:acrosin-like n=1 Tax=Siniperca chuatsi TaxID=119488 RepID=UPI001CE05FBC|nr:acrosin-like [Siniperca chuatsi]
MLDRNHLWINAGLTAGSQQATESSVRSQQQPYPPFQAEEQVPDSRTPPVQPAPQPVIPPPAPCPAVPPPASCPAVLSCCPAPDLVHRLQMVFVFATGLQRVPSSGFQRVPASAFTSGLQGVPAFTADLQEVPAFTAAGLL